MSQIICNNVSLNYGSLTAVQGLNFTVNKGDYLCIVGENGAGKTTLIKALLGLKEVSSGKIVMGDGLYKNEIGYLPQQTQIQKNFPASVFEIVISGTLNTSAFKFFYAKQDIESAREKMELLDILELKNRCYAELSGGQQQRVLLARALCAAKKMLLLDEPVAGLDPYAAKDMYDSIKKINENTGMTIIMVSHDLNGAVLNASHILHLAQKKQLFFGHVDEYSSSKIGRQFIGDVCK